MKRLLLSFLFCSTFLLSNAQSPTYKNSLQFHLETLFVKADQRPQSPVLKYSLVYARKLGLSRWIAEGGLSYTNRYVREQFTPFQFFFPGDRSQLITADLTFLYNLLKSDRHALRIGIGPSFWYVRNEDVTNLSGTTTGSGQQVENVSYSRNLYLDSNLAFTLRGHYEYSLSPRLVLGLRASVGGNALKAVMPSTLAGTLSTIGVSAGYRF